MGASFTKFKDRIWFAVDGGTKRLATAPAWVQSMGYGLVEGILYTAYIVPRSPLRGTATAFSKVVGQGPPRKLYKRFTKNFTLALRRMETLRLGRTDEIDRLLNIPEVDRLESSLSDGKGAILVMPHCHGSVVMVRALASRYPVLMLVRGPAKEARAITQRPYYTHIGCELFDVRQSTDAQVARAVLGALKSGKIVVGVVDRIKAAPPEDEPVRRSDDSVRATIFEQPAGFVGWPARFAARCKVPILPVMVEQTSDDMTLHIGASIPAEDTYKTTQMWVTELEKLYLRFPTDWGFVYDKHWSRVMHHQAQALSDSSKKGRQDHQ